MVLSKKQEKVLFFDTGPIISLVMSRLDWILPKLKEQFGGKFYITPSVRRELIERPITIKRFQFEALQVLKLISDGVLEIYDKIPTKEVNVLINLANSSFKIGNKTMDIIQEGEMESLASALKLNAGVVIDERTIRLFVENNKGMEKLLERRFHKNVTPNLTKMNQFSKELSKVKIIRSIELVSVAYKLGILNDYIPKLRGGKRILVNSILWSTKYNGCAVTPHEIEEIKKLLLV